MYLWLLFLNVVVHGDNTVGLQARPRLTTWAVPGFLMDNFDFEAHDLIHELVTEVLSTLPILDVSKAVFLGTMFFQAFQYELTNNGLFGFSIHGQVLP